MGDRCGKAVGGPLYRSAYVCAVVYVMFRAWSTSGRRTADLVHHLKKCGPPTTAMEHVRTRRSPDHCDGSPDHCDGSPDDPDSGRNTGKK